MNSIELPEAYIYLYHTDEYFIIPQYPDQINDNLGSTFSSTTALARTAPTFSFSNSGPRSVQVNLSLHRDMMTMFNKGKSNVKFTDESGNTVVSIDDDYTDVLIKKLQAVALPRFNASESKVVPPMVAIRFGEEIFIKGVVNSGIALTYKLPLLENNKYACVDINFNVYETEPFDAESVGKLGSFRGLTSGIKAKVGLGK